MKLKIFFFCEVNHFILFYFPLDTRTPAFFCPSSSISFSVTAARRARSETSGLATSPTAESSGSAGGHPRSLSALTPKYRGTGKLATKAERESVVLLCVEFISIGFLRLFLCSNELIREGDGDQKAEQYESVQKLMKCV